MIRKIRIFVLAGCFLMAGITLISASKSSAVTLHFEEQKTYTDAYKVLALLNKARKSQGKAELKMDKELLEVAMQRASEAAVRFDHVRPNGQSCFTISDRLKGENLGAGNVGAAVIMKMWLSSELHRKNLLRSKFHSVGIGCVTVNGYTYWAQSFGTSKAQKAVSKRSATGKQKVSASVRVSASKLKYAIGAGEVSLDVGKTDRIRVYAQYKGMNQKLVLTEGVTYTSADTSVAVVGTDGVLQAQSEGMTTIVVKAGSWKTTVHVQVLVPAEYIIGKTAYYSIRKGKSREVTFVRPRSNSIQKIVVPSVVRYNGVNYQVTRIAGRAFGGCAKLKKITIKTKKLRSIGEKAFTGIRKKASVKVPKKKKNKYRRLLTRKTGILKNMKIV